MKPFIPEPLPPKAINWETHIETMAAAHRELGIYQGILQGVVNPTLFLAPMATREAVLSSHIEGSQATLEDVLGYEAAPTAALATEDIREIINYREALKFAMDWLKQKPITVNLIKEIHLRLLDSVRGANKGRGQSRFTQNRIGRPGSKPGEATYVPPPPEKVMELMSALEHYLNGEEKDRLVQLAVVHAQFEMIHPFVDGNGRVGRILIPLFLVEKKLLADPVFYISDYIDANRDAYYDRLNGISSRNAWDEWISFFLTAVAEQARANSARCKTILDLYAEMKQRVENIVKAGSTIRTLDTLFQIPVFTVSEFTKQTGMSARTAARVVEQLETAGIVEVRKKPEGRRPAVLQFSRLVIILS